MKIGIGVDQRGNRRLPAVGSDHDFGANGRAMPIRVPQQRSDDPAFVTDLKAREYHTVTHISARAAGCIDEDAIQHGPPRRAEMLDAMLRLNA